MRRMFFFVAIVTAFVIITEPVVGTVRSCWVLFAQDYRITVLVATMAATVVGLMVYVAIFDRNPHDES